MLKCICQFSNSIIFCHFFLDWLKGHTIDVWSSQQMFFRIILLSVILIHFSFFSHGKSSMELSLYSVLVYVCKVVSVCRLSVVPVHWPFVDRRRRGLSDGHLSVRPAESLVVVSIWLVYFFCHLARWSSLLGGCLAILSAGRASQPYSRPHVLAVFSVARLGHALSPVVSQPSLGRSILGRTWPSAQPPLFSQCNLSGSSMPRVSPQPVSPYAAASS